MNERAEASKRKGGRPSGRAPKFNEDKGHWEVKISIEGKNGKPSSRLVPMPTIAKDDKAGAIALAHKLTSMVRSKEVVSAETERTLDEQFKMFCKVRSEEDGIIAIESEESRWNKWVSPVLGTRPVRTVSPRELAEFVRELNIAVREGKILSSYAEQIWKIVRRLFKMSCSESYPTLKLRDDNPTEKLSGPKKDPDREGTYLHPAEFLALMNSPRVPLKRKRIYALAVYLAPRGSELAGLDLETGVNLVHEFVSVHQQLDHETGRTRPTKTKDRRRFKFEPNIRPLLEVIHRERGGEGRLVEMGTPSMWAPNLRKDLKRALEDAGLEERPELFADDGEHRPINFHDLRHTSLTWSAIRGGDITKIQRRAGHRSQKQTQNYIVEVEVFDPTLFGEVFPALPEALLVSEDVSEVTETVIQASALNAMKSAAAIRSEPPTSCPNRTI